MCVGKFRKKNKRKDHEQTFSTMDTVVGMIQVWYVLFCDILHYRFYAHFICSVHIFILDLKMVMCGLQVLLLPSIHCLYMFLGYCYYEQLFYSS